MATEFSASKRQARRSSTTASRGAPQPSPHAAQKAPPVDDCLAGETRGWASSAQAGFLPVPLGRVPLLALQSIPVYLRSNAASAGRDESESFVLYRSKGVQFNENDRARLTESGVKFVYVPVSDHGRLQMQTEARLAEQIRDPSIAKAEAAALVYETSLELVNEILSSPHLGKQLPRLENVARAVTEFTVRERDAFETLFLTAHHDFYTATHTVNVATWMVSLAQAMGYDDPQMLNAICQAGMLHDIGKIYLPPELLSRTGPLTAEDWNKLKQHPTLGRKHLEQHHQVDPLALRVTEEHHERLDGSGYPKGLTTDQIHPASKICAVVDSFDAMTAYRPYKEKTMTVREAMDALMVETPAKYDPVAMAAWRELMNTVRDVPLLGERPRKNPRSASDSGARKVSRRRYQRFKFHCPVRVHVVEALDDGVKFGACVNATAHNISRSGLAFLCEIPVDVGRSVRVYISARGLKRDCIDGRVARCHAYSDGFFDVGVALAPLGA